MGISSPIRGVCPFLPSHSLAQDTTFISVPYLATVPTWQTFPPPTPSSSGPLNLTRTGRLGGWLIPLSDLRYSFANPAQDVLFLPPAQLCLDPLGTEWDSKDLDGKEEPWKSGAGLPPTGCFPGPWRQDISLDCKGSPEETEARAWTVYYYGLLQSCLQQAGLPETQDRSQAPRTGASGLHKTGLPETGEGPSVQLLPLVCPGWLLPQALVPSKGKTRGPRAGRSCLQGHQVRAPHHVPPYPSCSLEIHDIIAYSVELKLLERCLRRCYGCS
jgi:hypothetical protein